MANSVMAAIAKSQGRTLPDDMEEDETPYASIGRAQPEVMGAQTDANFAGNFGNAVSQAALGTSSPKPNDDLYRNIASQAQDAGKMAMADMSLSAKVKKAIEDRKAKAEIAKATQLDKDKTNKRLDSQAAEAARHNRAMEALAGQKADGKAGAKMLPPDKVLNVNEGNVIPQQLSDIRQTINQNSGSFGPVMGRLNSINPYDEKSKTIEAQMRAAAQAFGRYMEGGVLRKEDEEKYRHMFPQLSDTPEVAKNKLAIVDRLLASKQGSNVSALKTSGYDVSGVDSGLSVPDAPSILSRGKAGSSAISEAQAGPLSFNEEDLAMLKRAKERLSANPNDQKAQQVLGRLKSRGLQ